jgi:transcriptional regulator with XRE-family HTH domain
MPVLSQLGVAGRVEHLFETIRNPKTGEPYTNTEVMRMSSGVLAEEDVERVRSGRLASPSMSQIAALAAAFGATPTYLLDEDREPSVLDEEVLAALADETATTIFKESAHFSKREKAFVLEIVRQIANQLDAEDGR